MLVLLFGLASCTVGPDYVRPTAPMQETFKEMDGWKQAEPREDLLRGKWWEIFTNSELSALQDQVDITNQNIASAAANFRQAVALVAVARASYFPTASISPAATRLYRSTGTASASASAASSMTAADVNIYSLPATASWVPDVWGLVRRNVESNRASAQASAALLENVRLSAHAQVAQDYFQSHAGRAKGDPPRDRGGVSQDPAVDREQVQLRRVVEGRCAPGGNPGRRRPSPRR